MILLSYLDLARSFQINFQDPATAIMEGIIELHNTIFFFLIIITILVFWMFYKILLHFSYQFGDRKEDEYNVSAPKTFYGLKFHFIIYALLKKNLESQKLNHNSNLEIIWVVIPAIILVCIAVPSFTILYSMDEVFDPMIIIKVIGHQWYWSYEYTSTSYYFPNDPSGVFENWHFKVKKLENTPTSYKIYKTAPLNFDSLLFDVRDEEKLQRRFLNYLGYRSLRLLETDTALFLPTKTHIQILVTSGDVIHSWAVPSLGVKIDCVPGRLNQVSLFLKRSGMFYGQCSEICGINHGFMPIKIIGINFDFYCFYVFGTNKNMVLDWKVRETYWRWSNKLFK